MRVIDFLDRLYAHKNRALIARTFLFIVKVLANVYVWCFMKIQKKDTDIFKDTVIVSLTTFPARIHSVWMTIACLLNQNYENMRVILWLSKEQFHSIEDLPSKLLKLRSKGLIIRLKDDDLRSHKKYFYAYAEYPNNVIVTVDDDILYNPSLVKVLMSYHQLNPTAVICNRGVRISKGEVYVHWQKADVNKLSSDILPTGIGGVLYPPHSLCMDIFDVSAIKQTCLYGDDLWLNFMCRMNHTQILRTSFKTGIITILSSQNSALCKSNCGENRNDKQIAAISNWARKKYSKDFFYGI